MFIDSEDCGLKPNFEATLLTTDLSPWLLKTNRFDFSR